VRRFNNIVAFKYAEPGIKFRTSKTPIKTTITLPTKELTGKRFSFKTKFMELYTCHGLGCDVQIKGTDVLVTDSDSPEGVKSSNGGEEWLPLNDFVLSENVHRILCEFPTPRDLINFVRTYIARATEVK